MSSKDDQQCMGGCKHIPHKHTTILFKLLFKYCEQWWVLVSLIVWSQSSMDAIVRIPVGRCWRVLCHTHSASQKGFCPKLEGWAGWVIKLGEKTLPWEKARLKQSKYSLPSAGRSQAHPPSVLSEHYCHHTDNKSLVFIKSGAVPCFGKRHLDSHWRPGL